MGIFGGKSHEEREAAKRQEQVQLHRKQAAAADQYDEMVTKALVRLTRWAFPDSLVERPQFDKWQLWHTTDRGKKYIDVAVTLEFDEDKPESFLCDECLYDAVSEDLTREALDEALRQCICSIHG